MTESEKPKNCECVIDEDEIFKVKMNGYTIEHDSEITVCIIPNKYIEITEFLAITEMYITLGYKYWHPADERGGFMFSKVSR